MTRTSRLTVMMTTDAVGGVWSFSCTLATALVSMGADVHLVTMGPPPSAEQRGMLRDFRIQLIETDLALEWQDPGGTDVPNARRVLAGLESRIRPDVIHLNSFREASFGWMAPVIVVAHSCVNSWARACNDTAWLNDPAWQHYTRATREGLNAANNWVSPSREFQHAIHDLHHPSAPGVVIWNGTLPVSLPTSKRAFLLAAGRLWDRAKNLSAIAELARGLEWPVLMAGPTSEHVPPGPVWLGSLDHDALQVRMRQAAIFVSMALYEPFGLAVLEAASAGCALVLSDIPTFRELWDDAALFVDPADKRELNRTIRGLCADYDRRVQLQHAAQERSRRYSLTQMASAYHDLYATLPTARTPQLPAPALEMTA
ncbi:glycosyltransferase family 4 protein [Bradyrhizobium sp. WSM 1704]|uniref:glycosyltransferase family 4 protein n=1 Tax=Bradyrhizobium semiaridum TaxID=2821404 RepID=UPI001CE3A29E|nr:glycosyltransferase family 4 protein [Bradyrhizobium semiaridum]MCA6125197.1 glycosyltransferase family 4 protein [Bradyrhizobium semiaridum]